ncbi:MAG TPA: DUF5335 family protein [Longimicrobium sp.]|nr:DUF5335 family protein [Longimicrobium sp.]
MSATIAGGWTELLRDFSRRNAGRATRLEVGDDGPGALWGELELRLRGVAFEPRFRRVEIALGDGAAAEPLTHSIEGVSEVDVRHDAAGRDTTLRIAHPGGETLLTLADA